MAHLEKYPKAGLSHLLKHNERTERDCHVNRSNKNIVPERTNKNYSFFKSFLESRPEWKKEFLRQREELARSQENRSRNYGRER